MKKSVSILSVPAAVAAVLLCGLASPAHAQTAEVCGNGVDDDGDGFSDEGCYPGLTNPLVDSPLSTADTGLISPSKGALYYAMPADIAAKTPYGVGLALRRTYVSMNNPGASPPDYRKPMGDRWVHNYMGWIDDHVDTAVIHLPSGQEIQARNLGSCNYEVRGGQAVKSLSHCSGASWNLVLLDGSRMNWEYNFGEPRLSSICSAGTAACVSIWYTASYQWQVSDVNDQSGHRNLHFNYTGSLLTSVDLKVDGVTQHTTTYGYTGNNLTSVTIGSQLAQTNSYSSNYLTQIADGAGEVMVKFAYDSTTAGKVVRIDTPRGMVGFEFASVRTGCSGANKTVQYFNRANTTTCTSDTDCGTGNMCGGKTGSGATGQCFRAARCMTVDLTAGHHEDMVTTVAALAPTGQTCDGACLDVSQYFWDNSTKYVASLGTLDPSGNYSVRAVNANGLATEITFGDPDNNASNLNSNRTMWLFYGDANFPGRITEIRRKSDLSTAGCDGGTTTSGCQRTQIAYDALRGKPSAVSVYGWTYANTGLPTSFNFVTTYSYDWASRVTQIDGPLTGSNDVTVFEYWDDPSNGSRDGFLQNLKRKRDATTFVTTSALEYDARGNPTTLQGADTDATHSGSLTCLKFNAARGFLSEVRKAMAGQSDCTTVNGADISTVYDRDSALRLTMSGRPDGSCVLYEYDHTETGRPVHLVRTKRRDDCLAGSSGDRQEYVYDAEGLVTELQTYDAANVLTAKQPFTYFDSRRLQNIVNPANTAKWTGITYDDRGLVSQVDGAGGIGKTVLHRDGLPGREGRVTSEVRYKDATTFDSWNLLFDWLGNQFRVTDGDTKATETTRDDLGRVVKLVSPDMTYPTVYVHDDAHAATKVEHDHRGLRRRSCPADPQLHVRQPRARVDRRVPRPVPGRDTARRSDPAIRRAGKLSLRHDLRSHRWAPRIRQGHAHVLVDLHGRRCPRSGDLVQLR
jgi:hypothetical protein